MASAASKAKTAPPSAKPQGFAAVQAWFGRNWCYVMAFFVPVILLYIAYAIFGLTPFGERSVLCLDLNGQYIYYFEAIRDAFWGDGSLLYNWTRNLSGDYSGIIGYYLASPFTLIVMLLPRTMILTSMLIMILCKLGAASTTMCYYLRKSKHLSPLLAVTVSIGFGMCAYGVIQTIDPMWLDGLVFLPLIALGVEYLVDDGRKLNYIIPLAMICIANFYIGFMCCIFTAFYFFAYAFLATDKVKFRVDALAPVIGRMFAATAVAICLAAFMILPVYNALSLGKFDFTTPDYSMKTQFSPLEFIAQLSINQYNSVNVEGKPEIYCGVLAFLTLPLFFCNTHIEYRKKLGYGFLCVIMFLSMWIKPLDMLWHGGQVPNWLPFRYSFIFSFLFLSMAGMTLRAARGIKKPALFISAGAIVGIMFWAYSQKYLDMKQHEYIDIVTCVWATILFMLAYAVILYLLSLKNMKKGSRIGVTVALLLIVGGELTWNAVSSFNDIHKEVCYSTAKSYNQYLKSGRELVDKLEEYDNSFYRAEKTYVRTVNDNAGFGLRGITHSSSVMNAKCLKFIEAMGYVSSSYYSRYEGNTPITDSLLGIKYVLDNGSDTATLNPSYDFQFSQSCKDQNEIDMDVSVYKNPNALSIGYMADKDILGVGSFGNDNPFNSQNILMSSVSGHTEFDPVTNDFVSWREYFEPLQVTQGLRLNEVHSEPYGTQTNYRADENAVDPTVDIFIEAKNSQPLYLFFKTENQSRVNLWMADQWCLDEPKCENQDGSPAGFIGSYFETDNYHILRLGSFEPGSKIQLRMTLLTNEISHEKYTIVKDFFFYHFREDLFQEDIDQLKLNQWEMTKAGGRVMEGKITAAENQIMMTSIPYEPGWTAYVDGKKQDVRELFTAMVGVELTPGEHTVKLKFTPVGLRFGLFLFVLGAIAAVYMWQSDKKNNKMVLLLKKNHANGIYDLPEDSEEPKQQKGLFSSFGGSSDKSSGSGKTSSVADEIRKLKALYDEGVITQEEFEAQKKKLLNS